MGFSCGIIGLPNVGKSTLFNALTKKGAESSNYPFCTIDPNIGVVPHPDNRMQEIIKHVVTKKVVPTFMHFTDIAGLIKGASQGQGLGNKFLAHIREVLAIAHVVRIFSDKDIAHVGQIDPIGDFEIVMTELKLKDMESIEKRLSRLEKEIKSGGKDKKEEHRFLKEVQMHLNGDKLLSSIKMDNEEHALLKGLSLLTLKPQIIVANVSETQLKALDNDKHYTKLKRYAKEEHNIKVIPLCAQIEKELANDLTEDEYSQYLETFGLAESSLAKLITEGHELLDLITFYTVGEKECRGWDIKRGCNALYAASKIHTDIEKGFIRAQIISYKDFVENECSYSRCKDKGKMRLEGKDYIMADGDIVHFRFNV